MTVRAGPWTPRPPRWAPSKSVERAVRRDEWSLPALGYVRRALDQKFMRRLLDMKELLLLFSSVLWLTAGGIAWLLGAEVPTRVLWTFGTIELSVDVIALLARFGSTSPSLAQ
jgi:hypothetical protein